jgi:NAD-dependent deacetylase
MNIAEKIAREINQSGSVCVLTGAGISTESGIPDFRGPEGLWQKLDPWLLSADALYNDPHSFYTKGLEILGQISALRGVNPNRAHYVLAELQKMGKIGFIITQNIDGLHARAGSTNLLEVHGSMDKAYCMECGKRYKFSDILDKINSGQVPPLCSCGGVIRPEVVLFGDMLGPEYDRAVAEVKKSDLLLVIGSSLEVSPVNHLPGFSSRFIIINNQPTSFDGDACLVWHQHVGRALEQIYEYIKKFEDKG